jgi:SAM-dependent methyltransferase
VTSAGIPLEETLRFLARALPPAPMRVLEAGAGDGALAVALAALGYDVTAVDEAGGPPSTAVADCIRWVEADFLYHDEKEPYDAVLFTRSLHHMTPVEGALDRAFALLKPGGLLIAEEFAYDRVNLPTARWYYDLESVLLAAGLLATEEQNEDLEEGNPLGRWRKEHAHDPPLHTGHAMLAAARERFDLGPAEEAPYLYRTFCARLVDGDRGVRVARRIFELESRLVRERDITAAGLRIVGKKGS